MPDAHQNYYDYQATARQVFGLQDVARIARERAPVLDRLVRPWLPGRATSRIVELGCGHGSFLFWLKEQGFGNILGLDSSPPQIHVAKQTGVDVLEADAITWLETADGESCAALVAVDLIEHLPKERFMECLHHAYRVLSPGGVLILRYPNGDSPFVGLNLFNDITHTWTYTTNCLRTLALMNHFSSAEFRDEGIDVIHRHRWIKLPVARLCRCMLAAIVRTATRERIHFWSPHIWACLTK